MMNCDEMGPGHLWNVSHHISLPKIVCGWTLCMNLTAGCLRRGNGAIWLSGPGRLHTDTRLLQGFLHWIANQLPWKQQEVKSLVVGTNDSAEACHLVGTKTLKLDGVPYCTLFFLVPSCPCSLAPCCRNHRKSQKHPIVRPIAMVLVWINIFMGSRGHWEYLPATQHIISVVWEFSGFPTGFPTSPAGIDGILWINGQKHNIGKAIMLPTIPRHSPPSCRKISCGIIGDGSTTWIELNCPADENMASLQFFLNVFWRSQTRFWTTKLLLFCSVCNFC